MDFRYTFTLADRRAQSFRRMGRDRWLKIADPVRKSRRYRLSAEYRQFIGEITAGV